MVLNLIIPNIIAPDSSMTKEESYKILSLNKNTLVFFSRDLRHAPPMKQAVEVTLCARCIPQMFMCVLGVYLKCSCSLEECLILNPCGQECIGASLSVHS